jgi:hypothetical protein
VWNEIPNLVPDDLISRQIEQAARNRVHDTNHPSRIDFQVPHRKLAKNGVNGLQIGNARI